MRALLAISSETYLTLKRDKIFLPTVIIGFFLLMFSSLASDWGIEEFYKILFDLGSLSFHITGAVIALIWGTKIISKSQGDGSLEIQIASPISRSGWLIAKYLGLATCLLYVAIILLILWQGIIYYHGLGWMSQKIVIVYSMFVIEWLVIAAIAVFFASFSSSAVSLFCSSILWIIGLISPSILATLPPATSNITVALISNISSFWNFQRFNLTEYLIDVEKLAAPMPIEVDLTWRLMYGIFLIGFLIGSACILFNRKDLT